jgi:hypothetical protein
MIDVEKSPHCSPLFPRMSLKELEIDAGTPPYIFKSLELISELLRTSD